MYLHTVYNLVYDVVNRRIVDQRVLIINADITEYLVMDIAVQLFKQFMGTQLDVHFQKRQSVLSSREKYFFLSHSFLGNIGLGQSYIDYTNLISPKLYHDHLYFSTYHYL